MVLGLKEGLVECATVCVKSVVILIWVGGPENCNFPLLYVVKMFLPRLFGVQKSLKTPLRNIKMAPSTKKVVWNGLRGSCLVEIPGCWWRKITATGQTIYSHSGSTTIKSNLAHQSEINIKLSITRWFEVELPLI